MFFFIIVNNVHTYDASFILLRLHQQFILTFLDWSPAIWAALHVQHVVAVDTNTMATRVQNCVWVVVKAYATCVFSRFSHFIRHLMLVYNGDLVPLLFFWFVHFSQRAFCFHADLPKRRIQKIFRWPYHQVYDLPLSRLGIKAVN